ncbi:hypothetical protein BDZ89DRAFT_1161254 [Hymenopellis radicata]|nr:hypothetical protein BDZ89DRAFT_1161254 [Hymenopellis radicata]
MPVLSPFPLYTPPYTAQSLERDVYYSPTTPPSPAVAVHLQRYGCRVDCPAFQHNEDAFRFFFENRVERGTSIQVCGGPLPSHVTYYARHDHEVDEDLMCPIPYVSRTPSDLTRPIHVWDEDAPGGPGFAVLHVSDPDLRISEVRAALSRTGFTPTRYQYVRITKQTYPFDLAYWRSVRLAFEVKDGVLFHKESQRPMAPGYALEDALLRADRTFPIPVRPPCLKIDAALLAATTNNWYPHFRVRVECWRVVDLIDVCGDLSAGRRAVTGDVLDFPLSTIPDFEYVSDRTAHSPHRLVLPVFPPGGILSEWVRDLEARSNLLSPLWKERVGYR